MVNWLLVLSAQEAMYAHLFRIHFPVSSRYQQRCLSLYGGCGFEWSFLFCYEWELKETLLCGNGIRKKGKLINWQPVINVHLKVSIYPSGHANDEGALESFSALVIYRESKLQIALRDFVAFGKIIPSAGEVAYGPCTGVDHGMLQISLLRLTLSQK